MAISLSQYVNIQSAQGAGTPVATRALIGRMFTANPVLAPQSFLQFSNASDVGSFFGTDSEEYYRAFFYFSWVGKSLISPPALQFSRWASAASDPLIYSIPTQIQQLPATWAALTAGSFGITINGTPTTFSFDTTIFSGLTTYVEIAAALTTLIQVSYTDATVTAVGNGFVFDYGVAGAATISVQPGTSGTDISQAGYLGWYPSSEYPANIFNPSIFNSNALWIPGSAAETLTQTLNSSQQLSNNFGSFLFLNNLALTISQIGQIAAWNAAAAQNNMYLYTVPVIAANVSSWTAALNAYEGLALTLGQTPLVMIANIADTSKTVTGLMNATTTLEIGMPVSGTDIPTGTLIASITNDNTIVLTQAATGSATESLTFSTVQFPEQAPMMIEAATNYYGVNAVQNYMFQTFDPYLTPLVTSTSQAQSYDALSVNYYGQTQTAGTVYNFYQRGLLQGGSGAPTDQNTYVNEIWLKDALAAALMGLLLGLTELPANTQGQALALVTIQGVINQALTNGSISVGKILSANQIAFITSTTGDDNAWYQVQNSGYWVNCVIQPIPDMFPVQYEAAYTLIYSKDDVIRFISGQDILI